MSRPLDADKLKPSPLSARIVKRLRQAGLALPEKDDCYALMGLRPGHWQKSAGAWAWTLYVRRGRGGSYEWTPLNLGSSDPASSLRASSVVSWRKQFGGDVEVTIDNPRKRAATK